MQPVSAYTPPMQISDLTPTFSGPQVLLQYGGSVATHASPFVGSMPAAVTRPVHETGPAAPPAPAIPPLPLVPAPPIVPPAPVVPPRPPRHPRPSGQGQAVSLAQLHLVSPAASGPEHTQ